MLSYLRWIAWKWITFYKITISHKTSKCDTARVSSLTLMRREYLSENVRNFPFQTKRSSKWVVAHIHWQLPNKRCMILFWWGTMILVHVYKYHQASVGMMLLCPFLLLSPAAMKQFLFLFSFSLFLLPHVSTCWPFFVCLLVSTTFYCWVTILHASLVSLHLLGAETLRAFVLDYLFMDVCTASRLGKLIVPPSRAEGSFIWGQPCFF